MQVFQLEIVRLYGEKELGNLEEDGEFRDPARTFPFGTPPCENFSFHSEKSRYGHSSAVD